MNLQEQLKKIDNLKDEDIDYSDIPNDVFENFDRVDLNINLKKMITVRFDADIIDWFKSKGAGYQTKMNSVLRLYINSVKKIDENLI